MNGKQKTTLNAYFSAVDRRLSAIISGFYSVSVYVCGKLLTFHFEIGEQAENARRLFKGLYAAANVEKSDADFFCWQDDPSQYLPADAQEEGVWVAGDETGYLHIASAYGLTGADYIRNKYYFCRKEFPHLNDSFEHQTTITPLFRWAWNSDLMLMHGAAVGANGKGVLIGAKGGNGKSTLAVACLMKRMEFTADDYLLLTRQGPHKAMPLYSTINLNPDMESILCTGLPVLRKYGQTGEKLLLDASELEFCQSLPIRGIIFPIITNEDNVQIKAVPPGRAITQMVHSILGQVDVIHEMQLTRSMVMRLSTLPVYEMMLSTNPFKNADYLEEFISKNM